MYVAAYMCLTNLHASASVAAPLSYTRHMGLAAPSTPPQVTVRNMLQVDLLDMLYQKSLRLGVDVRNARGIGTVVNLQSNDASKVWMMPVHIHTLWNSPFQVCEQTTIMLLSVYVVLFADMLCIQL